MQNIGELIKSLLLTTAASGPSRLLTPDVKGMQKLSPKNLHLKLQNGSESPFIFIMTEGKKKKKKKSKLSYANE